MNQLQEFDPFNKTILANPYPVLNALREADPIHWNPIIRKWMILKYEDFMSLCRDQRLSSRPKSTNNLPKFVKIILKPLIKGVTKSLLLTDNPDHARLRSAINKVFLPKIVQDMQPRIQEIADELLNQLNEKKKFDFISDFAFPLPMKVIAEILGISTQNSKKIRKWSKYLSRIIVKPKLNLWDLMAANYCVIEMQIFFNAEFVKKRKNPSNDLLSKLLFESGEALSEQEIFSMCMFILLAGHETTTNLIGNGLYTLLKHPDQLRLLKENPELIEYAVEEILRFDSSVQALSRVALEDIYISGKKIKEGDAVMLSIASANRDPSVFASPDAFDITRKPIMHASFGRGNHFCIGAALARMEIKIAISTFLHRFPNFEMDSKSIQWINAISHRGLKSLSIKVN